MCICWISKLIDKFASESIFGHGFMLVIKTKNKDKKTVNETLFIQYLLNGFKTDLNIMIHVKWVCA